MNEHATLGGGAEFDAIRSMLARWGSAARGIGDDAAVLNVPTGERLVVSTDNTVEGVHFRREWLSPLEIGWRATMAALSDLAAMGAAPRGILVALTVPVSWRAELGGIADGIGEAVTAAETYIVGGDISGGNDLALTISVIGSARMPIPRSGAHPGDVLFVSGVLGGPALALRAWLAGETPAPAARERFARPVARIAYGLRLGAYGCSAAIDISDGLIADVKHVAAASSVAIDVDLDAIPRIDGATAADAATSGEEYELLVTGPASFVSDGFTRIGTVRAGHGVSAYSGGARVDIAGGYDHFSR